MRIEGVLFWVFSHRGECEFREKNILGKSCTTFVIVKIVRNLSRGRSPCQRVNHIKSGVIYFFAFIYSCIRYYSYVKPGPNNNSLLSQLNTDFFFFLVHRLSPCPVIRVGYDRSITTGEAPLGNSTDNK